MQINTPAEAFVAIATAVVGADGVGTDEERTYLATEIASLPVFAGMDSGAFQSLLVSVSDSVWASLPNDGVRFTADGLDTLIDACSSVLDPGLRIEVCRMAEALADVDYRTHEEHGVILSLKSGFGLPQA